MENTEPIKEGEPTWTILIHVALKVGLSPSDIAFLSMRQLITIKTLIDKGGK